MKDYSLTEEEKRDYVIEYDYVDKEKFNLYVKFPKTGKTKGVYFTELLASQNNIKKLDRKMEEQMNKAIDNEARFVLNKNKSLRNVVITPILGVTVTGLCMSLADTNNIPAETSILIAGGIITLAGFIPCLIKHLKDKAKVNEIEKAKYLKNHKDDLDSLGKYQNSLAGADKKIINLIENEENPFKVNNLEFFSKEDLENIILNIERENKFNFEYTVGDATKTEEEASKIEVGTAKVKAK